MGHKLVYLTIAVCMSALPHAQAFRVGKESIIQPVAAPPAACVLRFLKLDQNGKEREAICSGVITSQRTLLTAAHCVADSLQKRDFQIQCAGGGRYSAPRSDFQIHPRFARNQPFSIGDIAELRFQGSFQEQPISIAADSVSLREGQCQFVGAGENDAGEMGRLASAPIDFFRRPGGEIQMHDEVIPIVFPETRPGDSGGPLICYRNNKPVIVAIHQAGYSGLFGMATRIFPNNFSELVTQIKSDE